MLGFTTTKKPANTLNSIYYTPKRSGNGIQVPTSSLNSRELNSYNASIPKPNSIVTQSQKVSTATGRPATANQQQPQFGSGRVAAAMPQAVVPHATGRGLVEPDTIQVKKSILKQENNLESMKASIGDIGGVVEELRATVEGLEQELASLRSEANLSSLGTIKVRFLEDVSSADIGTGSVMYLRSPYENNDEGLWATRQSISLGTAGLEIQASLVLIARRTENSNESGGEEFFPLIEIIEE